MINATRQKKLTLVPAKTLVPPSDKVGERMLPVNSLSPPTERRPEMQLLFCCARRGHDSSRRDELLFLIHRGIDWDYLLTVASQHGVVPLVQQALSGYCADEVPTEVLEKLKAISRSNAQHNLHLTSSLLALLTAFEARSVSAVPYKGPMLAARAYGNLSSRQFCDLDILVRQPDVLKAIEVLTKNGYRLELPIGQSTPILKLIHSKKDFRFVSADNRVVVELHWRLAGRHFYFPYSLDLLWERLERISFSGTAVLTFRPEDMLVILCAHGSKHLWGRLLWICDIAALVDASPRIDWSVTMRNARESGSQRMVLLGLYLAKTLLDTRLPREVERAIRADRAVEPLAKELLKAAFPVNVLTDHKLEHNFPTVYPLFIRMRERRREKTKLRFQYYKESLSAAITPGEHDREYLALPSSLSFLYYLVRPVRLIRQLGLSEKNRR